MKTLLRFFFRLLYHQLAFTYDLVAAMVSLGRWKDWVSSVLPFISGTRILELGHGPGHLQRSLLSRQLFAVAIDESAAMSQIAKRNTHGQAHLARALGQELPFADQEFDTIIATFPTEYIFEQAALLEVKRCLSDGGRFIVLPVAMQIGRGILDRAMALLFRVTHQSPVDPLEIVKEKLQAPFIEAGFALEIQELQVKSSLLLLLIATHSTQPS